MAGRDAGQALEEIGYGDSGSLRAGKTGNLDALLRRWSTGNPINRIEELLPWNLATYLAGDTQHLA